MDTIHSMDPHVAGVLWLWRLRDTGGPRASLAVQTLDKPPSTSSGSPVDQEPQWDAPVHQIAHAFSSTW